MAKKKTNKNIKCDVDTCKHNNKDEECCELESVKISCTCNNDECECTEETVCQSFENTASPITDNEYEVNSEDEDEDNIEEE